MATMPSMWPSAPGEMHDKEIVFSPSAKRELLLVNEALCEILATTYEAFEGGGVRAAERVEPLEETIDAMIEITA